MKPAPVGREQLCLQCPLEGAGVLAKGGATVLKVGGTILRAERAKKILDPPLFGQWGDKILLR